MRLGRGTLVACALTAAVIVPGTAGGHTPGEDVGGAAAAAFAPGDETFNFTLKAAYPLPDATSSDIAFWGDRAFVGNYRGFRIFDLNGGTPLLLADVQCNGAQGDPSVWDRDEDGVADTLILSVDRTMTGPECGAAEAAHDDPDGWEGLRIFDVEDPKDVRQIATVYQDCGSHTNTIIPRREENRLLVLNSSYPLRPGPTCGPVRGPEAGRDPLHGVVQVVEVPLDDPTRSREVEELPISYPGDDDNNYKPITEHGLNGGVVAPGLVDGMRACHDIAVHTAAGLVGAACGEQAQVWKLDKKTGLPDTTKPKWVYDQDNVDFWHSATFTWDGKVVNFIDESFGDGCPTKTVKRVRAGQPEREYETGNMFFMGARSGEFLSEFRIPRSSQNPGAGGYCSSHLGNVVPAQGRYLLANAYYLAGSSVIDFTNPRKPKEVAYGDRTGAGTWSTYWFEGQSKRTGPLDVYANDGVSNAPADRNGFEAWAVSLGDFSRTGLPYLNPQTQEQIIRSRIEPAGKGAKADGAGSKKNLGRWSKGRSSGRGARINKQVEHHLATP